MQQQTEAPIVTEYAVKRTLGGKVKSLAFHCPHCSTPLSAELGDAGNHETCPKCGMLFRVPLHEEPPPPPKPKPAPKWTPPPPKPYAPPREPMPYQFMYIGAVVLFALGVLTIVAAIIATVGIAASDAHGGLAAAVLFGGVINGFFLIVTGQALDAFRDLVLAAKSIDDRLGKG